MIEEYIANSQFQDALDLLTDLDDETVRYQRLVCLYGLGQYQQAKNEGMLAKIKASNTYYDVVSIYLATLKELEEHGYITRHYIRNEKGPVRVLFHLIEEISHQRGNCWKILKRRPIISK